MSRHRMLVKRAPGKTSPPLADSDFVRQLPDAGIGVADSNAICNSSSPAAASRVRAVPVCWPAPVASAREQRMLLGDNTCVGVGGPVALTIAVGLWDEFDASVASGAVAFERG